MRILVVEDEPAIADFLARGLDAEGYAVTCAVDGTVARRRALGDEVDLVILDLVLPGMPGLEVLREIRVAKPDLPVIVLSARGEVEDRVAGLDRGATDYVTKPFSFAELAARVRAHLRRPYHPPPTRLQAAGIVLDVVRRTVQRNGVAIELSPREFDLLAYFLRHSNLVLTREQLLEGVWGYDFDPGTNVVEVYVCYVRRKLARAGEPAPIVTLRSVGYKLVDRG
jgi:DNA-binding response OmpR family regulator